MNGCPIALGTWNKGLSVHFESMSHWLTSGSSPLCVLVAFF